MYIYKYIYIYQNVRNNFGKNKNEKKCEASKFLKKFPIKISSTSEHENRSFPFIQTSAKL